MDEATSGLLILAIALTGPPPSLLLFFRGSERLPSAILVAMFRKDRVAVSWLPSRLTHLNADSRRCRKTTAPESASQCFSSLMLFNRAPSGKSPLFPACSALSCRNTFLTYSSLLSFLGLTLPRLDILGHLLRQLHLHPLVPLCRDEQPPRICFECPRCHWVP